jgi:hypothetical protein
VRVVGRGQLSWAAEQRGPLAHGRGWNCAPEMGCVQARARAHLVPRAGSYRASGCPASAERRTHDEPLICSRDHDKTRLVSCIMSLP